MNITFLQFLLGVLFLSIIYLHLARKNFEAVVAYAVQSSAITVLLFASFMETNSIPLLFVVLVTLIVKAILGPVFFFRLIQKHKLTYSVSTYLNMPLALIIIAVFTAISRFQQFSPLTNIIPANHALLSLALAAIFTSLFLIINRKDAISQAIGVLSMENSIVAFAIFAGLEQSPMLQLGIVFDIFIWLIIATVFISMIYRHFGSLDTSTMKHLKD